MIQQQFVTTCWNTVLRAGAAKPCRESLERLCRAYWPPVFQAIRRKNYSREDAEDLTQDFFAQLLRYDSFGSADQSKGRFRSFLMASLKNFLVNHWHHRTRLKRGGGRQIISLDESPMLEAEAEMAGQAEISPEEAFDRNWATTVLQRVNARLRAEYESAGQATRFEALKGYLLAGEGVETYAETARRIDVSESAVKSAVYKMRQRYGNLLRAEIAETVLDPNDVEDEISCLLLALR